MTSETRMIVYHIPVCPFSQRLEILLDLKGLTDAVTFHKVDITVPRPDWLQEKLRNTTALPALETEDGRIVKESLVILRYLEDRFPEPLIRQADPYRHAVENMLIAFEGNFATTGYRYVLNQDRDQKDAFRQSMLAQYRKLDDFLAHHSPEGTFLFEDFGLAETVFTPMFMRFWFLDYYEDFALPDTADYARVRRWRDACMTHPAARQVTHDEIIKLYYDYAKGAGNGALLPGRRFSSFVFEPHWATRPMPPRDKYVVSATDTELGLVV